MGGEKWALLRKYRDSDKKSSSAVHIENNEQQRSKKIVIMAKKTDSINDLQM